MLLANEFFDALPVRQFQMTASGWRERRIDRRHTGDGPGIYTYEGTRDCLILARQHLETGDGLPSAWATLRQKIRVILLIRRTSLW